MIKEILKQSIVPRTFYLKKITNFFDSNIVKVIVWQRRVGKSYILKSIIQNLAQKIPLQNFFYINKEDLTWDYIKDYLDLKKEFDKFLENVDKDHKIFVWIDGVQEISWWEKFVIHLQTKFKNIEIFITWSNSKLFSWDLASLLTGRYVEFHIWPLDLEEFSLFKKKRVSKKLFFDYLKFGWLPWIFEVKYNQESIFDYLRWVYNTIVLKDIVRYFRVRNISFLDALYKFVFANIGNIFSAKNISDYLKSQKIKIWVDSVLDYLYYWINAYLLYLVKASDPKTKKYFEIYNKYYVGDIWLRNAIVWFNLAQDIGWLLENYVYLVLRKNWYEVKLGRMKVYDKTTRKYKNLEIDFIAEKDWKIKYFQVSTSVIDEMTRQRELKPLQSIKDNWEKYIITLDDINWWEIEGIKFINILDLKKVI